MLKKLYKINGIIYLPKEDNIKYNYIFLKNYVKYKETFSLDEIHNISKKQYYTELGCKY